MSNDDMKEKLSALVDDELGDLDERRLMAALEKDAELRQTWERYHLMRSVLRQELEAFPMRDMAERVAAQVGREPVSIGSSRRQIITRYAGTLAIAASVAAIAVASVQWFNRPVSAPVAPLAAIQPAPDNFIRAGTTRWDTKQKGPETESTLNAFLVEHNEFAPTSGMGGMMPYVRVVGYDNPVK